MNIKRFKKYLFAIAVTIFFVCCCSISASADVWDGEGLPVPLLA